jgi:uncharacterized protein (TIGR00369 family)
MMNQEEHYRCLESMYAAAPINDYYNPTMKVSEGRATIEIEVLEKHHHAAGAMHGSVYFKMLDDAAFFASNSFETDVFVLTTSFTIYLTRPVSAGRLRSVGRVVNRNKTQFISESIVYDSQGNEIGRGNGIFVRSKIPLKEASGYIEKK